MIQTIIKTITMARTYNSGWREWFNTQSADVGSHFVVEGLQEQIKQLDSLLASNPEMEAKMRRVISRVLVKAQKQMQKHLSNEIIHDPRHAAKAVRKAVYRRILGGNINILNKRRAGTPGTYTPTRTLRSGQRGGNRMARSERTMRMESYTGDDRGFVIRFLNSGTDARNMEGFRKDDHRPKVVRGKQGGDMKKYGNIANVNTGNRGRIAQRGIFSSYLVELGSFIDKELTKEFAGMMAKEA